MCYAKGTRCSAFEPVGTMAETDYDQLKFVLNFFIKAKDECTDAFVLFDENAATYILDIADRFQAYAWSNDTPAARTLRIFDFALTHDSALFHQMLARIRRLAESEYYQRKFRGIVTSGHERQALTAYFAPFRPDDTAMSKAVEAFRKLCASDGLTGI